MEIRYFGWKSFRVKSGLTAVITYPFSQKTGISFPKTSAEIVISEKDIDPKLISRISGKNRKNPFLISGPGEYEISEIEVLGFPGGYWFKIDGVVVVFLNNVDKKIISKLADGFQDIGVIFFPSDNADLVKEVLNKVSPSILIPYCSSNIDKKDLSSFSWASKILDILDLEKMAPLDALKIDKQNLSEETQVHLLRPKI
jgi:hypothetical protein